MKRKENMAERKRRSPGIIQISRLRCEGENRGNLNCDTPSCTNPPSQTAHRDTHTSCVMLKRHGTGEGERERAFHVNLQEMTGARLISLRAAYLSKDEKTRNRKRREIRKTVAFGCQTNSMLSCLVTFFAFRPTKTTRNGEKFDFGTTKNNLFLNHIINTYWEHTGIYLK